MAFEDEFCLVRASHPCIALLENNVFNRGKFALKALEAGAMNGPIIAPPVGEYAEIDVSGILHINSPTEWESRLDFVLQPENYMKLSSGLRERMQATHDIDKFRVQFLEFATAEPEYGMSRACRDLA